MITDFVRDKSEVRIRVTSLFKAGRLLTFSAFRMGAYSRWALIRGWALIRINTVTYFTRNGNMLELQRPEFELSG